MSAMSRPAPGHGAILGEAPAWLAAMAFPPLLAFALLNDAGSLGPSLLVLALLLLLPSGLLTHRPLAGLAFMLTAWAGGTLAPVTWRFAYLLLLANAVAIVFVSATRARRTSLAALAMTLSVQLFVAAFYLNGSPALVRTVMVVLLIGGAAWMVGDTVRERRAHAEALKDQATARAVTDERLRIARELHDVVAHSIGIIAIQAGVGGRVMESQPSEARDALSVIEATSRDTLAGLRGMLGSLRRAGPAPLAPGPRLADLDRLADAAGRSGVRVGLSRAGRRRPLPAEIELAAFRIVQESITNVVRHAGTDHCLVAVDYRDGELAIAVTDAGRGTAAGGAGYGITGMRERVTLLGGDFSAGPRPEGGFQVTARLPLKD
ncbi:sensor histidine kinase [Actinomadura harenae]|uniref:histidine kinase n=1 Tax=Actinomadura harenae TaxID=2483351 RepID=A0A3M2MCB4_9ACTN|nr:histidine kinase [Actinomadura harenae]RMI47227.1 sensor histidine kinase [Actinomadura harenae]